MKPPAPVFRLRRAALGGALVLLASCGASRRAALPPPAPLPTTIIYDDDAGGMRDSVRLVVRDAAELEAVWRVATRGSASPPPLPAIDFAREMVLVVGAGRMTPADRIRVDSVGVRREGRAREVMAVAVRTTRGCERFDAAAWPVQLVRVRRHDGPVLFVEYRGAGERCPRE